MKKLYIIANWKSNKTIHDALIWLEKIVSHPLPDPSQKEIIVCASFTLLASMKQYITDHLLPIRLGAQDISPFAEGAYTGAINGKQIKEFADYVIIGHSERRREFTEDDAMLQKKVEQALASGLTPIYCVLDEHTQIPDNVTLVAYELASAIGTGTPDTPQNAEYIAQGIKDIHPGVSSTLYGASVNPENVKQFTDCSSIDGVLVGGASLDAEKFLTIIANS